MEENYWDTDFGKVRYRQLGQGEAVIFIHGYCENGSIWNALAEKLSNEYRILIVDYPGFYTGSETRQPITMELMADAVSEIAKKEKVANYAAVGHSMGGYVCLELAKKYFFQVRGISLVNSHVYGDSEATTKLRRKAIQLIEKGGKDRFVRELYHHLFHSLYIENNATTFASLLNSALSYSGTTLIDYYKAMMIRSNHSQLLKELKVPVQIISGEEDQVITKQQSLEQMSLSAVADVHLLKECGHMAMYEKPTEVYQFLENYLGHL